MARPGNLKQHIKQVLGGSAREAVIEQILSHRPRRVINALIARFYDADPVIRWRGIAAAGAVVARLADADRESARVIMRRLMWMLNDESGGIGWGAPEAMGEIMAASPALAAEYAKILCSYVHPEQNYLEHPGLQCGLLWGLGRLAQAEPGRVKNAAAGIAAFLESADPYHRGFAAWALGNAGEPGNLQDLRRLTADRAEIEIFDHWHMQAVSVGELARQAVSKISPENKED
ncbi:MAG: HEAT repeat domain-containing protein [Desulfobacterales bacterium]|nr:HEAT repeat domain-containing protein [Desulfobacterales bacterium]MBS3755442.1 HEAT repeat domain-containing protein [Desulfobacterales bacterium]